MNIDWNEALKKLTTRVSHNNFNTWLKPLTVLSHEEGNLTLGVPNKFFRDWLLDNYLVTIRETLKEITGRDIAIQFSLTKDTGAAVRERVTGATGIKSVAHEKNHPRRANLSLNPNYIFDRFVVGSSNQFAHAASISVATKPAQNFNPLFIYGGVGLGKTHLLNAIGHQTVTNYPAMNVFYISAEAFMNELINAIRFDATQKFREKYRKIECLLIDDIQFIAGKDRTQEEFFHTFNSLHDSGKQIVVTSDKFPKDIPNLESRLRSRFEWGLIADIHPPDTETKIAIINKKAEENNIIIPQPVAFFIAERAESNIREIEGFLTRIAAYASLSQCEITLPLVNEVLHKIIKDSRQATLKVEDVIKAVGTKLDIKVSDIKSASKNKNYVLARQVSMYLSRKLTGLSFPDIGEKIGNRDHSTVIYACNKVTKVIQQDEKIRLLVNQIENHLTND